MRGTTPAEPSARTNERGSTDDHCRPCSPVHSCSDCPALSSSASRRPSRPSYPIRRRNRRSIHPSRPFRRRIHRTRRSNRRSRRLSRQSRPCRRRIHRSIHRCRQSYPSRRPCRRRSHPCRRRIHRRRPSPLSRLTSLRLTPNASSTDPSSTRSAHQTRILPSLPGCVTRPRSGCLVSLSDRRTHRPAVANPAGCLDPALWSPPRGL